MSVFLHIVLAIIMTRTVTKYAQIPEVPSIWLDFLIQLLHISTFIVLFISLMSTEVSFFSIALAAYYIIYIIMCIKDFILDIIYVFFIGYHDDDNNDVNDDV